MSLCSSFYPADLIRKGLMDALLPGRCGTRAGRSSWQWRGKYVPADAGAGGRAPSWLSPAGMGRGQEAGRLHQPLGHLPTGQEEPPVRIRLPDSNLGPAKVHGRVLSSPAMFGRGEALGEDPDGPRQKGIVSRETVRYKYAYNDDLLLRSFMWFKPR